MTDNLILTYSLLGYLKETTGSSTKSLTDIFVPIAKKALSDYSKDKGLTEIKGRSLSEIKDKIQAIFELEIPIPILFVILKQIEIEVNNFKIFFVAEDGAFVMKSFVFNDIDNQIIKEKENIDSLKNDYELFCKKTNTKFDFSELKEFILAQKIDLFSDKKSSYLDLNYTIPKYINQKFKDDKIFNIIANIYLGGIMSSYLTLKIDKPVSSAELLIDTNFFISLIDLNTEDSYHTCKQLFELCKSMGFRFLILHTTVEQIKILLNNRITDFKSKDIIGTVRSADVFNACVRRELDKTQLEKIKDSIPYKLNELGIVTIQEAQIKEITDKAKNSQTYRDLKKKRDYELSALNDAIAQLYVQKKRGIYIKEFTDVKCWFLHNSFNSHYYANSQNISDRYSVGANELLVLLWLSNPSQMESIHDHTIVQGTLSSYVTKYRRAKMPSKDLLKIIKTRADKAIETGQITEIDLYRTCIRMAEGHLIQDDVVNIENITDEEFAKKIQQYSKEEEIQIKSLSEQNELLSEQNEKKGITINEQQQTIEKQQKAITTLESRLEIIERKEYDREKEKYVKEKINRDKTNFFLYIGFILFVSVLWFVNYFCYETLPTIWASIISFVLFVAGFIVVRFINHSNIKSAFCKKEAKIKYQKEFDNQEKKS